MGGRLCPRRRRTVSSWEEDCILLFCQGRGVEFIKCCLLGVCCHVVSVNVMLVSVVFFCYVVIVMCKSVGVMLLESCC